MAFSLLLSSFERQSDCGKTISVQQDFDSLHVWDKPSLSGSSGLFCLSG
jgi:hypothetical protein